MRATDEPGSGEYMYVDQKRIFIVLYRIIIDVLIWRLLLFLRKMATIGLIKVLRSLIFIPLCRMCPEIHSTNGVLRV